MSFIMIVTGRYFKSLYRIRMILHSITGFAILILTAIFVSYADKGEDDSNVKVRNWGAHEGIGSTVFSFTVISIIVGALVRIIWYALHFLKKGNTLVFKILNWLNFIHKVCQLSF